MDWILNIIEYPINLEKLSSENLTNSFLWFKSKHFLHYVLINIQDVLNRTECYIFHNLNTDLKYIPFEEIQPTCLLQVDIS